MRTKNTYLAILLVVIVVFFFSNISFAGCDKEDMEIYDEGVRALKKEQFGTAELFFKKLYDSCGHNHYFFFMGYINDQYKKWDDAKFYYKEYIQHHSRKGSDYREFAIERYEHINNAGYRAEHVPVYDVEGKSSDGEQIGTKTIKVRDIHPVKKFSSVKRRDKYLRKKNRERSKKFNDPYLDDPPTTMQ